MKLNKLLSEIQNKPNLGTGRKRGGSDRKPSPSFAYELVYGRKLKEWRGGRYPGYYETKDWNGIQIDKHLKNKWINDLNNIPLIEVRGSCEGHNKEWISFISFRITDPEIESDKKKLNQIVKYMNKFKNTFCGYDIGVQSRPRFVCATNLFYSKENYNEWNNWWEQLVKRLQNISNKNKKIRE